MMRYLAKRDNYFLLRSLLELNKTCTEEYGKEESTQNIKSQRQGLKWVR